MVVTLSIVAFILLCIIIIGAILFERRVQRAYVTGVYHGVDGLYGYDDDSHLW